MQANWLAVCSRCYKERQIIGLILTWELNNFQQFLSVSYTDSKSVIKVCMLKTALGYWTIIYTYRNAFLKGEFVKVYLYVLLYWMHVYQTGNWPAKSWLFILSRKPRVALTMINRLIIWPAKTCLQAWTVDYDLKLHAFCSCGEKSLLWMCHLKSKISLLETFCPA